MRCVQALPKALQEHRPAQRVDRRGGGRLPLTVEDFCKWVKEYLDTKGPKHRIIFLVDEVGQFIGSDTHLMLNLADHRRGAGASARAEPGSSSRLRKTSTPSWVRCGTKRDFSKIQGRFTTRLSLSSANVDEVIQARLLAKATMWLRPGERCSAKGDILKNQLTFTNDVAR